MLSMALGIDPKWELQLKPHLLPVAEQLRPSRHQLPTRLYSKSLIKRDEEQKFQNSTKTETDLALEILTVLRHQCVGSFDQFCDVLLEVGDESLCDVEKLLRPGRTESRCKLYQRKGMLNVLEAMQLARCVLDTFNLIY